METIPDRLPTPQEPSGTARSRTSSGAVVDEPAAFSAAAIVEEPTVTGNAGITEPAVTADAGIAESAVAGDAGVAEPAVGYPRRWPPARGARPARRTGGEPGEPLARRSRIWSLTGQELLWISAMYLATRIVLLVVADLNGSLGNHNFLHELANWDGLWYRQIANHGYLDHVSHAQTTLGFFPLYPIAIWIAEPVVAALTGHDAIWSASLAGAVISTIGGFVATVIVYRLATGWWGRESAWRATILFCLFPGSVVFTMVYSEGILLALAAGCIFALERRRWLLAGILAGLGTAVEPTGLVLIPVCAVSAVLELRRQGWTAAEARRVLVAPVLSLAGVSAFALFLWLWTGTPLANYEAQHYGWREKTDPFALVHLATTLAGQISFTHLNEPTINLNLVVGLAGTGVLLAALVLMLRDWRAISAPAIVWTLGISWLALTSEFVPPNPRMLIIAFPAIMVLGHYLRGRWFTAFAWFNGVLLVVLSVLTFYGTTLRP